MTRDTGARYPILQAPMTWVARAQLAAAVSAAGALGMLENSSRSLEVIQREIAKIRAATDQPYGIHLSALAIKATEDKRRAVAERVIAQRPKFVVTSAGDPRLYARQLKDAGITVYHAVPSLEGALKAEDAGVDGLIVEGAESAGIRAVGGAHTFVLLQAVRERVDLPLVATGGIVDGRGMAAAFALGAGAVGMGTRFVASVESPVHAAYKGLILEAGITGTVTIPGPRGSIMRALRTPVSERVHAGDPDVEWERYPIPTLYIDGDIERTPGTAGESAGLIHAIKPVAEIVRDMIDGFWREIDRLAALRSPGAR